MANALTPGEGTPRPILGSGAQAFDPVGEALNASKRMMQQIADSQDLDQKRTALELAGETYDERGFLGGFDSPTTASERFRVQSDIFNGRISVEKYGEVAEPQANADFYLYNKYGKRNDYETPERTQGKRTGYTFKGVALAPSALADLPTSTSDWKRPRTVAAGYDYDIDNNEGTITVVFRDGTFYNYYKVPADVWIKFHQAFSKGPFLNKASKNGLQAQDGTLLAYKHGPADVSALSQRAQDFLYKAARTVQILNRQIPTPGSNKVGSSKGNAGFTPRRRNINAAAKRGGYNPNSSAGRNRKP